MTFDFLFKQTWTEDELAKSVSEFLSLNFDHVKKHAYFFKLKKLKNGYVRVAWMKEFADIDELQKYNVSFEYQRCYLRVYFEDPNFKISLLGYENVIVYKAFSSNCVFRVKFKSTKNREKTPRPPLDTIAAFQDITSALQARW